MCIRDRLSPNLIDESLTRRLDNGNRIKNGVEINAYGRPTAFYLRVEDESSGPDFVSLLGRKYFRLAAADAIFIAPPSDEDPAQVRGMPLAEAALESLKMLSGYMEAEVIAARVSASKMGFYTEEEEGAGKFLGDNEKRDSTGAILREAVPGTFEKLPKGIKVQSWDPQHPNKHFSDFVKTCLRKISAGLGMSYTTVSNDLEGVTYGSQRAGLLEERDEYATMQTFLVDQFCMKVYRVWFKRAHLKGRLPTIGNQAHVTFMTPTWIPRRWAWIDPLKDASAAVLQLNNRLTSRRKIAAESGMSIDDIIKEIAEENELMSDLGVSEVVNSQSGIPTNGKSPQLHAVKGAQSY